MLFKEYGRLKFRGVEDEEESQSLCIRRRLLRMRACVLQDPKRVLQGFSCGESHTTFSEQIDLLVEVSTYMRGS